MLVFRQLTLTTEREASIDCTSLLSVVRKLLLDNSQRFLYSIVKCHSVSLANLYRLIPLTVFDNLSSGQWKQHNKLHVILASIFVDYDGDSTEAISDNTVRAYLF